MKKRALIFIVLLSYVALAQNRDRRALLQVEKGMEEFSVSPDGKVWLNLLYSTNIDSSWHSAFQSLKDSSKGMIDAISLNRISFFNKDTAILTGSIRADKNAEEGGYFLTKDGGKHWQIMNLGNDLPVMSAFADEKGNAWLGSMRRVVYFSKDFGQHWVKLKLPYNNSHVTNSIFMLPDGKTGIAAGEQILVTENNWISTTPVITPFRQRKYGNENDQEQNEKIIKVSRWKDYWLVNQNHHVFYSDIKTINWKSFPIELYDFETDQETGKLFAITSNSRAVVFNSPSEFYFLGKQKMEGSTMSLKTNKGSLYVMAEITINGIDRFLEFYQLRENEIKRAIFYTLDKKIDTPSLVRNGKSITWGVSGKHIYLQDKYGWYREKVSDFEIEECQLTDDSTALFWDGIHTYEYSLKDQNMKLYLHKDPLKEFLKYPVVKIQIHALRKETHDYTEFEEIEYARGRRLFSSALYSKKHSNNDALSYESYHDPFRHKINGKKLASVLATINEEPYAIPKVNDFEVSSRDKKRYLRQVRHDYSNKMDKDKYIDAIQALCSSAPKIMDTLGSAAINEILGIDRYRFDRWTRHFLSITFVNANMDILSARHNAYLAPWQFEYKKQYFNSYDQEFSRFVKTCLPKSFESRKGFDNTKFLRCITSYLYMKNLPTFSALKKTGVSSKSLTVNYRWGVDKPNLKSDTVALLSKQISRINVYQCFKQHQAYDSSKWDVELIGTWHIQYENGKIKTTTLENKLENTLAPYENIYAANRKLIPVKNKITEQVNNEGLSIKLSHFLNDAGQIIRTEKTTNKYLKESRYIYFGRIDYNYSDGLLSEAVYYGDGANVWEEEDYLKYVFEYVK